MALPMREGFRHAAATRDRTESLLVGLCVGGVWSWGEGAPRAHVDGTDPLRARESLEVALPSLVGPLPSLDALDPWLDGLALLPAARCAVELSVLDATARARDQSLIAMLGGRDHGHIRYSGVLPLAPPEALEVRAAQMRDFGITDLKLKLDGGPGDRKRIERVRRVIGPSVGLRVDYNGSLHPAVAAEAAAALLDAGVHIVEQPATPGDEATLLRLREVLPETLAMLLDDDLLTVEDVRRLRRLGVLDRALLKVSKHGGLLRSLAVAREATSAGIPCHLGCHVGESSLLSAAGRILAALHPFETAEGSYGFLTATRDLRDPPLGFGAGGLGPISDVAAPGLGFEVPLELALDLGC